MNSRVNDLYPPPIWEFNQKIQSLIQPGIPVLNLNQAEPDYPPPDCIRNALASALSDGEFHRYTADEGLPELREEIIRELDRLYGCRLDTESICVTSGANNAFLSALPVLAGCGDEIILLAPYYFNHHMAARILGIEVREILLDAGRDFALPLDDIRAAVTSRTRALVLVNPGNPTGRSYSQADVDALHALCIDQNIFFISDEVYNYFHDDYPQPASPLRGPGGLNHAISLHSFSKTFSITGMRVGFIAASPDFIRNFLKVHDTGTICAPRLSQIAAREGLRQGRAWLEKRIEEMHSRSRAFERLFRNRNLPFRLLSRGAFFLYLEHDFAGSSEEVCAHLAEKQNLILLPGHYFGSGQEKTIRIALGNLKKNQITDVLDTLATTPLGAGPAQPPHK